MEKEPISLRDKFALNIDETAAVLGLSRPVVYDLIRSEGFPSFKVGRRTLVSADGLRAWIAAQAGTERDGTAWTNL